MAYLSKRSGKEVDELLDRVERGGSGSITIDTELSETSNNAVANSAVAKALKDKQDTLTLTTKPNGNIVIGNLAGQTKEFMPATPSGDPMHYMYEAAGAVWNEDTGYWELNGLVDITNEEMREIYSSGFHIRSVDYLAKWFLGTRTRTNINKADWTKVAPLSYMCANSRTMLHFHMGEGWALPDAMSYAFYGCQNIVLIIGVISGAYCTNYVATFGECYNLQYINIHSLKADISFPDSPLLSKESLLYMIDNCAEDVSFTITLHPDVYNKCSEDWLEDIDSALGHAENDKQTNITLASA